MYNPYLHKIQQDQARYTEMLVKWCNINSGSHNKEGLTSILNAIKTEYETFQNVHIQEIPLQNAPSVLRDINGTHKTLSFTNALQVSCRPNAPIQIFLNGHMDTVYDKNNSFQHCQFIENNKLQGPGVADMKGGLIVMLAALQAFEQCPWKDQIGWEVFINPDEEIGSPGTEHLFAQKIQLKKFAFGLIFEPTFADGTLVRNRKGIMSFSAITEGRSAHVGRNFNEGRNAIAALAEFVTEVHNLNKTLPTCTLNVGYVEGGGPINVVPDRALANINVRVSNQNDINAVEHHLANIVEKINKTDGILISCSGRDTKMPKVVDSKTESLFELIQSCGKDLGLNLSWKDTGGASDGNTILAAGLPNIDTMGVRGGDIHSPSEYMFIDSITERAQLTALLLMKIASKEISIQHLL